MKLQLKRSNVIASGAAKIPTSAQLEYGELAINYNQQDPAIFLKDSNNNVIRIGGIGNIADDGQVELPTTTNPPTSPTPLNGNLWYNSQDGRLYVYYVDANSSQWVDASPDTWQSTVIPDITNPSYQAGSLDERYVNLSGDTLTGALNWYKNNGTVEAGSIGNADDVFTGGVDGDLGIQSEFGNIVFVIGGGGGGEAMRVTSSGLVGINTASPAYTLDVNGAFHANGHGYFTQNVLLGGDTQVNQQGVKLYAGGLVEVCDNFAANDIFRVKVAGSGNYNISMTAGGGATFRGRLECQDPIATGLKEGFVCDNDAGGSYFQVYTQDANSNNAFSIYNGTNGNQRTAASITPTGSATFSGTISTSGQNTINEASALKFSQETNAKSQIRAYGPDASTNGSLEFKVSPTSGTALTPLTLTSDGNATFAGRLNAGTYGSPVTSNYAIAAHNNNIGTNATIYACNTAGGRLLDLRNNNVAKLIVEGTGQIITQSDASIQSVTVGRGTGNVASNTAVGDHAIFYNTSGSSNTGIGYYALISNTSGSSNTAVGHQAMYSNSTGVENTAVGRDCLVFNTTGLQNTATGYRSLYTNTTGSYNTASGINTLFHNTTGSNNTALGYQAGYFNTTGGGNTGVGQDALYDNSTGNSNTAMGFRALSNNTTANQNTAIGFECLNANTTGGNNVALGLHSSYGNTTGANNVSLGVNASKNNTSGGENTAVGYKASEGNSSGNYNSSFGAAALISSTSNYNAAGGWRALYSQTTGQINTAFGAEAMYNNGSGSFNCAFGYGSLRQSTSGQRNVAVGYQALYTNTSGGYNTSVGMYANYYNTTGNGNDSFGYTALHYNTTGLYNSAIGYQSLYYNTSGSRNAALGLNSLHYNTTGIHNVGLGHGGLYNNTTGSGNIGVGFYTSSGSYSPVFNPSNQDNRLVLGHTSITNAYVKVSWTVTSDERDKMNFAPVPYGLDFVNQLKPTAYQFKVDRDTETPNGGVRYGFKAQDILALEGEIPVIIDIEDPDHLKYKGEHLVPVLVNAVQELTTMVRELQAELKTLKG